MLACCALSSYGQGTSNSTKTANAPSQKQKAEVIIIGSIHKTHYTNSKYSPDILKQIILSLKPDVILNELPLSQVDPNGRPTFRNKQTNPEGWAADTVATQLGVRQIPFDRPDRQENFKKTDFFKREDEFKKLIKEWRQLLEKEDHNSLNAQIARLWSQAISAEAFLFTNGCPEVINSDAYDSVIRIKNSLWYEIIPVILQQYTDFKVLMDDCHFFKDQWNERNRIMADNIIKAAKEYPGKRLIVVTGATHRYILRDLLKNEESIELKEYWEVKGLNTGSTEIEDKKTK